MAAPKHHRDTLPGTSRKSRDLSDLSPSGIANRLYRNRPAAENARSVADRTARSVSGSLPGQASPRSTAAVVLLERSGHCRRTPRLDVVMWRRPRTDRGLEPFDLSLAAKPWRLGAFRRAGTKLSFRPAAGFGPLVPTSGWAHGLRSSRHSLCRRRPAVHRAAR